MNTNKMHLRQNYIGLDGKERFSPVVSGHEIELMNIHNKEGGIRNFLRKVEFQIHFHKVEATMSGSGISLDLYNFGGIKTDGYSLMVLTLKGRKYKLVENGKTINSGKMIDFKASDLYVDLSY